MLNEAQESSQEQLMAAVVAPEGIVGESNRSECASVSVCAAGKGQQNVGRFEVAFQRNLQPSGGTMYAVEADQEKHNGHNWKPLREHDYIGLSDVSSSSSSSFLHNGVQQPRGGGGEKVVREEEEEEELNLNLGATELRLGPLPNHLLLLESGRRIAKEGGVEGGGSSSLKRSGSAAELVAGYCGSDNARECQGARDEESLRLGIGLVPKRDDAAAAADSGGRSTDKTLMGRGGGQQQQPNNLQERPKQELILMQESDLPEMMMHHGGTAARGGAAASNSVTNPRISADPRYPQEPPRYVAESMLADLHRSGIMQEFMEWKHMMRQGGGGGEKNGHFWLGGNSEPPHHLPHSSSCPQEPLAAGGGSSRSAALCPPPPLSKNGMGGAKRGFSEVIGNSLLVESRRSGGPYPPPPDGRNGFADGGATVGGGCSAHANSGRSNSAVEISQQHQKHHAAPPPSAMYPCSNPKPSPPPAWQQQSQEQSGNGSFGAFHSQQQQQPPPAAPHGGLPLMSNNRGVEMSGGVSGNNLESNPKAWDSSQLKNLHQEASSEIISKHPSPDTGSAAPVKDAAVPTTAPPPRQSQVIGWPPVRNFRRQQLPRPAPQPTSTVSPPKPPATSGTPSQTSLLVKVYMDGRPIGRKVNLTINNSYDKLKSAVLRTCSNNTSVAEEYKLVPDTLYYTVSYIDRFLSSAAVPRQRLQLLGVSCMLIAAKYEEICAPQVEEFCYITDNTYCREEVLEMERRVLNELNFELTTPTTKSFLRRFVRAAQAGFKMPSLNLEFLGNFLAELTLMEYSFLPYLPSLVAASAVFMAKLTLDSSTHPWDPTLQHYTGYKASELRDCVIGIHELQCNTKNCTLPAIREKYRQHKIV